MKEEEVDCIFLEVLWNKRIPHKYAIFTQVLPLSEEQVEYLTNDDTNPIIEQFLSKIKVEEAIKKLGGAVFVKIGGRSGKDCSHLMRKLTSVNSLVMLIKMSEYLTEALCDEVSCSSIVIRSYQDQLESGDDQFRAYVLDNQIVGICQKNTSFLGTMPTTNQISAIISCKQQISPILLEKQQTSYVLEVYCSPNGKKTKIIAIQPFHINGLSLFTEQELRRELLRNKGKPMIRMVETESQLKDIDLSEYRPGSELKHLPNVRQWIDLMQKQSKH